MLSKLQMKLEIPKRSRNCYLCAHTFKSREKYHSALFEEIKEGLVRNDYCEKCWDKALIEKIIAFWSCEVSDKKERDHLPKDKEEKALHYLQNELTEEKQSQCLKSLFLLALFLQRKKVLLLRKEFIDEQNRPFFIFEVVETEEILIVQKVFIHPEEIQQLQEYISLKLAHYVNKID